MKVYRRVEVQLHEFWILTLGGSEWLGVRPSRFTPEEGVPNKRWVDGCVESRASLEALEESEISFHCTECKRDSSVVQSVA
jgi:hypothetical protein